MFLSLLLLLCFWQFFFFNWDFLKPFLFPHVQLQLTRIGLNVGPGEQSIVVPLMYEIERNTLGRVEKPNTPAMQAVSTMLNRFAEHYQQSHVNECAILPAVKELLTNLVLPV